MASIAALIWSLPDRAALLAECLAAVHAQSRPVDDIVVGIDPYRLGEVGNGNRLLDATDSEWLAFCHDDDLWYPNHLEVCQSFFADADVVVSRYDLVGRPPSTIERWHTNFEDFRFINWIGSPSMVVARRSAFGRWCEPSGRFSSVDWANWIRLQDEGARFVDTGLVTTAYRFGDWGNRSWQPPGDLGARRPGHPGARPSHRSE